MTTGICNKVAILGMGCTIFGEHWELDSSDLLLKPSVNALPTQV